MVKKIVFFIILSFTIFSCEKKENLTEIKSLLLSPENYHGQIVRIEGKIRELGPLELWFVLEDQGGYIQITTERFAYRSSCFKKDKQVVIRGYFLQFMRHSYVSMSQMVECW